MLSIFRTLICLSRELCWRLGHGFKYFETVDAERESDDVAKGTETRVKFKFRNASDQCRDKILTNLTDCVGRRLNERGVRVVLEDIVICNVA